MQFLDQDIQPLGMGCWPIGGPMFSGDEPLGYANSDDAESIRTIHAALDAGVTLFDTAAAYGAGHAERLLAIALKDRPEALVATKIGVTIDEDTKQLTGVDNESERVLPAIDRCLERLERDRIDLLLLHLNSIPVAQAAEIFDQMDVAVTAGKVRAYGWSSDFADSVSACAGREAFIAVEHAMNVLLNPPRIQSVVREHGLTALIRSPLAMGLLSGKYGPDAKLPSNDVRSTSKPKTDYFINARPNRHMLDQIDAVHDLLTSGGRSLSQGAICWLWAKGSANLPIPGVRTVAQIEEIAGALSFGALDPTTMSQIDALIVPDPQHAFDDER